MLYFALLSLACESVGRLRRGGAGLASTSVRPLYVKMSASMPFHEGSPSLKRASRILPLRASASGGELARISATALSETVSIKIGCLPLFVYITIQNHIDIKAVKKSQDLNYKSNFIKNFLDFLYKNYGKIVNEVIY